MKWISVKEQMPEFYQNVLVVIHEYGNEWRVELGNLRDDNEYKRKYARNKEKYPVQLEWMIGEQEFQLADITHWMPLPLPPKDEK